MGDNLGPIPLITHSQEEVSLKQAGELAKLFTPRELEKLARTTTTSGSLKREADEYNKQWFKTIFGFGGTSRMKELQTAHDIYTKFKSNPGQFAGGIMASTVRYALRQKNAELQKKSSQQTATTLSSKGQALMKNITDIMSKEGKPRKIVTSEKEGQRGKIIQTTMQAKVNWSKVSLLEEQRRQLNGPILSMEMDRDDELRKIDEKIKGAREKDLVKLYQERAKILEKYSDIPLLRKELDKIDEQLKVEQPAKVAKPKKSSVQAKDDVVVQKKILPTEAQLRDEGGMVDSQGRWYPGLKPEDFQKK